MIYLDVVFGLNFLVDLLLLMAANRIAGFAGGFGRCCLGGLLGGAYGAACLLPGFSFLGGGFWRIVFLWAMAVAAYGMNRSAVRRCGAFILLSLALGGAAASVGKNDTASLVLCTGVLGLVCAIGFPRNWRAQQFVQVTVRLGGITRAMTALLDTGNALRDPLTGKQVLVVGPQIADDLLGLTEQQLLEPVQTVADGCIPGLRLIPYRTVGTASAMLLAIRPDEVRIGAERRDIMLAFAPNSIGNEGYEALAGGMI